MARTARLIVPGFPYHLTQRGNHQDPIFFSDADRQDYVTSLAAASTRYGLDIWAWCLLGNHVHLIVVPHDRDSLSAAIRLAHGRYAQHINKGRDLSGHLWSSRYYACLIEGAHYWNAVKYVELNPVRAGLATRAEHYPWSSARSHAWASGTVPSEARGLSPMPDPLLAASDPFPGQIADWSGWLANGLDMSITNHIRKCTSTGKPLGDGPL